MLNTAGIRVLVLAFEHGHRLTEHQTPRPLLPQAIDGAVRAGVDGHVVDLRPGGLIYVPASTPHQVEALEPSDSP